MRDFLVNLKAEVRRIVHETMASSATYVPRGVPAPAPKVIGVRFHTKIQTFGDAGGSGYAEYIEGITRLVFNREELDRDSIVLAPQGVVRLTDPLWRGAAFVLVAKEPLEGPIEEAWHVTYLNG